MKRASGIFAGILLFLMLTGAASFADDMAARLNEVLSKAPAEKFWQVSPEDVKTMLDSKKDVLIVDVRPVPILYRRGHIPGAVYIPTQDVLKPESLAKLPKDRKLILVCVTGQTQNLPVVALRALGYDAWTMKFGMASWDKDSIGVRFMKEAIQGAEKNHYPLAK